MAFCTECGAVLGGGKFCGECGKPLPENSDVAPAAPALVDFASQFAYPGPVPKAARRGNVSQRLVRLGNVQGRPKDEIVALLGPPSAVSAVANGCSLLQWQKVSAYSGSWHYALIFDGHGICGGITHEFVH